MQASERAVSQDIADAHDCALPYLPDHNAMSGVHAAMKAQDYAVALQFAETLHNQDQLFPAATVHPGHDVVTLLEVHLQFGRYASPPSLLFLACV